MCIKVSIYDAKIAEFGFFQYSNLTRYASTVTMVTFSGYLRG